ncbi:MAG: carboxypeptidase regulatory-like domain-containing protein [candidate division WS1 bacterium]|jgi:hypothetical protein|nr:carboxypeptidase regulatory-like domain-containing protein [candidate division WS1 bacterium]
MNRKCSILTVIVVLALTAGMAHAATFSITVVDKATGGPLSKALVVVMSGESVSKTAKTSNQGTWSDTVPAGANRWVVSKTPYFCESAAISFDAQGNASVRVEMRRHSSDDYKRLGRIVGFVRAAGGQPIPNATLVLLKGNAPVGATQPENPAGVYELQWFPPGSYTVLATAPGFKSAKYAGQSIAAGESVMLDITLQK